MQRFTNTWIGRTLIALTFISITNVAARAQGSPPPPPLRNGITMQTQYGTTYGPDGPTTVLPFSATMNGQVRVPLSMPSGTATERTVYYRPSGISKLQSGVDGLGQQMSDLQTGQQQIVDEFSKLKDDLSRRDLARNRNFGPDDVWWWVLLLIIVLLIAVLMLSNRREGVTINNNIPACDGCDCTCDGDDGGFILKLGRELQDGDEISIRKVREVPAVLERISTEKIDVSPEVAALMRELLDKAFAFERDERQKDRDAKKPETTT